MPVKNGNGKMKLADTFKTLHSYVNDFILPLRDNLIDFKDDMYKKKREYEKAKGKANIQQQKLDNAYEGLVRFREK